jgi:uncharacterized protein YjbI with pentapeptide repeats
MNQFKNLSEFQRGDFFKLSNESISDQRITRKNFSQMTFIEVKFFNSIFHLCSFGSCKFNNVYFNSGDWLDCTFEQSQLIKGFFDGSLIDNVKILNSTLEQISFLNVIVEKSGELIQIEDYSSFLKETSSEL